MGDGHHSLAYLKFAFDVPGKPVSARLRIYSAGNPSGNSGRICLVDGVDYVSREGSQPPELIIEYEPTE